MSDAPSAATLTKGDRHETHFTFTQDQVAAFAKLTGDANPLHLDAGYAAGTLFKRPIMHGFLSASIFSKVLGMDFPGEGTIYMEQSLRFMRPMFVDREYAATFEIEAHDPEKHTATIHTQVIDVESGKVTIGGEARVMNPNRL